MFGTFSQMDDGFLVRYGAGAADMEAHCSSGSSRVTVSWQGQTSLDALVRFCRLAARQMHMDGTIDLVVVTDSGVERVDVETLAPGAALPSSFIRLETGNDADRQLVVWGNLEGESPAYDNVGVEFHAADIFLVAGSLADAVLATPLKNGCYDQGQVSAAVLHMPSDFLEAGIGITAIQT